MGKIERLAEAHVSDTRVLQGYQNWLTKPPFQCALTSPPYATALPYIDTQRLSLVWLRLVPPFRVSPLESDLIGSRETRGKNRNELVQYCAENKAQIPEELWELCNQLNGMISAKDGFRRQAVPKLLYRYFRDMQLSFKKIIDLLDSGSPFALIVGKNHTILGGKRIDLDTPTYLISLAESQGWILDEDLVLQTYQRYEKHSKNAVSAERLLVLKKA